VADDAQVVHTADAADPVGELEIADRLCVTAHTVHQWVHEGLLPEHRWTVSGRPAWNWPAVEAWARNTGRLGAPPGSQ
jgi:hypothetical protein